MMTTSQNTHVRSLAGSVCLAVVFIVCAVGLRAQIPGRMPPPQDTLIIFEPAEPLLTNVDGKRYASAALGLDILFSGSGWGVGMFYHHKLVDNVTIFGNFAFSPRRNTDEFENVWYGAIPIVAEKVNRLFMLPVTIGVNYRLFSESLQESFRPFVSAGIAPTIIFRTPYLQNGTYYEFFNSFAYTSAYTRVGGMFSFGSLFGNPSDGNVMGIMIRYYTIPFGGDGLESMKGSPITNFGGVFLSLSVGTAL